MLDLQALGPSWAGQWKTPNQVSPAQSRLLPCTPAKHHEHPSAANPSSRTLFRPCAVPSGESSWWLCTFTVLYVKIRLAKMLVRTPSYELKVHLHTDLYDSEFCPAISTNIMSDIL